MTREILLSSLDVHVIDYRDGIERGPKRPLLFNDEIAELLNEVEATAAKEEPRPQQRAEFAILTPRGRWWRKLSLRLADPNGRAPSIFHSRERAEDEMVDVRGQAREAYGVRRGDYPLRLMVRDVEIGTDGTAVVGKWRSADELAPVAR
ncbi:hypothetical protein ACIBJI_40140 [Nocardia sp. NPDC050408]|uniref:hypothetical protein n=1 Tax=Nocardia sp. NPDC050408 TaxID=3364319 RepID=UPI0037A9316D